MSNRDERKQTNRKAPRCSHLYGCGLGYYAGINMVKYITETPFYRSQMTDIFKFCPRCGERLANTEVFDNALIR